MSDYGMNKKRIYRLASKRKSRGSGPGMAWSGIPIEKHPSQYATVQGLGWLKTCTLSARILETGEHAWVLLSST